MGDKGMVLGATDFRVKRIPDPKPQFAGKSGGKTSAATCVRRTGYLPSWKTLSLMQSLT
jgi:hypothetical protein